MCNGDEEVGENFIRKRNTESVKRTILKTTAGAKFPALMVFSEAGVLNLENDL